MEAGGKAHSAPFCLLSARCHGTEGVQSRRRGSQGLAGPWALSKGKLLEGKKKYRGSMMPAAKRTKPLYLLEELWHPGTSVFERPESLERLLQQARSATEGAIRGQLCWNADVTEKSKAVVPRVSGAEGQSLLSAREYME